MLRLLVRTNGLVLQAQLAGSGMDLHCIDAPHRCRPDAQCPLEGPPEEFGEWWWCDDDEDEEEETVGVGKGSSGVSGTKSGRYASYDLGWRGHAGFEASLAHVRAHLAAEGARSGSGHHGYVGVIGFSQGAALAHRLVASGDLPVGVLLSPVAPLGGAVGKEWDYGSEVVDAAAGNKLVVSLDSDNDPPAATYVQRMGAAGAEALRHGSAHAVPEASTNAEFWGELRRRIGEAVGQ